MFNFAYMGKFVYILCIYYSCTNHNEYTVRDKHISTQIISVEFESSLPVVYTLQCGIKLSQTQQYVKFIKLLNYQGQHVSTQLRDHHQTR
jgi:hypothetical protein